MQKPFRQRENVVVPWRAQTVMVVRQLSRVTAIVRVKANVTLFILFASLFLQGTARQRELSTAYMASVTGDLSD